MLPGGGQPVLLRHLDVHHHDVGLQLLRHRDGLGGRVRQYPAHPSPTAAEGTGEQFGEGAVIVDDQHASRIADGGPGGPIRVGKPGERQGEPP